MTVKASFFGKNGKKRRVSRVRTINGEISPQGRLFVLCAVFFVVGIVVGSIAVAAGNGSLASYMEYLTRSQFVLRSESKIYEIFLSSIIPKLLMLLLVCLFSHCAYGAPALIVLIVLNGIGVGMTGGYIYCFSGFSGIVYNLLVNTPVTLLFSVAFIHLSCSGIKTSCAIYDMAFKGGCRSIKELSGEVYHALAIGACFSCASAGLEALLYTLLGKMLV